MNLIKLIPLIALLVLVVFGALKGLKNGFKNQAVRLGTVILALFISVFVTGLLSDTLIASIENMSNESLSSLLDTIGYEVSADVMNTITENTGSFAYLLAIPIAFIIAPFTFLLVYFIFHLITIIPYKIISKSIVLKKEKKSGLDRLLGAGIGVVQALLIAVIIASPFAGITGLVSDSANAIAEESSDDFEEVNETLDLVPQDATITFLGTIGGNLIYENLATVDVHGQSYNMKDELAVPVIKLVSNASKLEDVNDFSKLTEEDKDTLNAIVEIFDDSQYISDLCANLLLMVTEDVGELLAGENIAEDNEEATAVFTQFTDTFVKVMENIAKDSRDHKTSLSDDLGTILSVYYTLSDYEVLSTINDDPEYAVDSLMKVVETTEDGKKVTVMTKVVNTLNTNEHTRPMVTVLSQISVTALAGQFDLGGDVDITKVYDDVKTSVNAIKHVDRAQGEETYVAEVSGILGTAFADNNLDIETDVIDDMAQYIYEHPETITVGDGDGNGELTDEEMNNLILSYYDVYVEYETSGEIPDDIPGDDLIPDGVID